MSKPESRATLCAKTVGWWGLIAFPIVSVLVLTYTFSLRLPSADYWGLLAGFYLPENAGLKNRLHYYWAPYVDHIVVFPKFTTDLLRWLTDNQHYTLETALGFMGRLATLYLVWLLARRTVASDRQRRLVLAASALLIFWPIQQFVFQIQHYSTLLIWCIPAALLTVYFLHAHWGRWRGLLYGLLASVICAYSQGSGLTLGLAVGLCLLPQSGWSGKQKAVWWLVTLVTIFLFALSVPSRADLGFPPHSAALQDPLRLLGFFFRGFAPSFHYLIERPQLFSVVGAALILFCVWPVLRLFRRGRLFGPLAFPWVVLIAWCLGLVATGALGRSATEMIPRATYFLCIVLALISAIVFWLDLYPNLWPAGKAEWFSPRGLLHMAALALLTLVYMAGFRQGVQDTKNWYGLTKFYEGWLRNYPATAYLRDPPGWIYPDYGRMWAHAFPEHMDTTPFTIPVPTAFQVEQGHRLEPLEGDEASPGGLRFVTDGAGDEPYIILKPSPDIYKRHVVYFVLQTSGPADVEFSWDDGTGWSEPDALPLMKRRDELRTAHWGSFIERDRRGLSRQVPRIRLKFLNVQQPQTQVTIEELQVFTR